MKLWKLSQTENVGYDTFDSVIVAAETEEEAKMIHPWYGDSWDGREEGRNAFWCNTEMVEAKYLGEATEGIKKGVILASYNA